MRRPRPNVNHILPLLLAMVLLTPAQAAEPTGDHPPDHAPGVDKAPTRPGLGDTWPDVNVIDRDGDAVALTSFQADGPTLFVFFMGSQCSGCLQQLIELGEQSAAFAEAGAEIVAVSADDVDGVNKTLANLKRAKVTTITVLGDPSLDAITALGTRMPDEQLSFHSVFLVDIDNTIRMVARGDMAPVNLPSPAVLLLELKKLRTPSASSG